MEKRIPRAVALTIDRKDAHVRLRLSTALGAAWLEVLMPPDKARAEAAKILTVASAIDPIREPS